jgi:glycosyltransferase involved in cell wall biosynthesis
VITIDAFGLGMGELEEHLGRPPWLRTHDDVVQADMHEQIALRRCYIHPFRWTSLGLSLVEAMFLGMPVVALATTDVPDAVPRGVGVVTNDVDALVDATRTLLHDLDAAAALGAAARRHALERFSLERFLADWNELLEETCR